MHDYMLIVILLFYKVVMMLGGINLTLVEGFNNDALILDTLLVTSAIAFAVNYFLSPRFSAATSRWSYVLERRRQA